MYIDIAIQHMYIYICSVFDHCYSGCNATHEHIIDQHVYMYSIMISNYFDYLEIDIVAYHNHTKVVRSFGDQIIRDYLRESPDYLEETTLNCCLLLHNPTLARAMFENCGNNIVRTISEFCRTILDRILWAISEIVLEFLENNPRRGNPTKTHKNN